ncbi:MAG: Peptidase family M50 [Alphaproteobacteria bacterium ADurb.Bin438]|nr:MAG: Peptidase family M50 [Alphaproteobacteria bacterium ADurb.Bin438]
MHLDDLEAIIKGATWIIPLLFSIIPHEIAHGYAAYLLGDSTAKDAGRLSINPIKHIDLYGTILIPLFLMISNFGFVFGYAKPVPVDFKRILNIKKGLVIVAVAGPLINFILAFIFMFLIYVTKNFMDKEAFLTMFLQMSFVNAVLLNLVLCFFNLIPIPPLDGGKIMMGILPHNLAVKYSRLDGRLGFLLVILLMILPNVFGEKYDVIGYVLGYFVKLILSLPFISNI